MEKSHALIYLWKGLIFPYVNTGSATVISALWADIGAKL
jgi:hypothetical protein